MDVLIFYSLSVCLSLFHSHIRLLHFKNTFTHLHSHFASSGWGGCSILLQVCPLSLSLSLPHFLYASVPHKISHTLPLIFLKLCLLLSCLPLRRDHILKPVRINFLSPRLLSEEEENSKINEFNLTFKIRT